MARKGKTRAKKQPRRSLDLEAIGLVLLALGVFVSGLLVPQLPTGEFGASLRRLGMERVGLGVYVLPWPLLALGGLFLLRRNPPAWPRVLAGYLTVALGGWGLLMLGRPELTGAWGGSLSAALAGAAGIFAALLAAFVVTLGVELVFALPPTLIFRSGAIRLVQAVRLVFKGGVAARNRAKARAAFHADVAQERGRLRELDRDLEALAGLYAGSSELSKWRKEVAATRARLARPDADALEDARFDLGAWEAAVEGFTRDRATELAAVLAAEGVREFDEFARGVRAQLDDPVTDPVAPGQPLDEVRKTLALDLTGLTERYRRLTRERDLAEAALREARPRDLVRASERHASRQVQHEKIEAAAEALGRDADLLESWRDLLGELTRVTADLPDDAELRDYSTTLARELREKGRPVLEQLEGWRAALEQVEARARAAAAQAAAEAAAAARAEALGLAALGLDGQAGDAQAGEGQSGGAAQAATSPAPEAATIPPAEPGWASEEPGAHYAEGVAAPGSDATAAPSAGRVAAPAAGGARPGGVDPADLPWEVNEADLASFLDLDEGGDEGGGPGAGAGAGAAPGPVEYPVATAVGEPGDAEAVAGETPEVGGIPIQLPPKALLDPFGPDQGDPATLAREVEERVRTIDETLANFRLEGRVVASVRGPTVTRFEVEPAPGEKISRFANLSDDLALAMAVGSVRIEAPIPGKSVIGLEVPNANRDLIRFREAAEAPSFKRSRARLPLILGRSIDGEMMVGDLARMPHLLIAGSTGSGKSVAVNTLIGSLLFKFLPTELRFLMIDPKMVELTPYDGIPHLLRPVVTNPNDAAAVLLGAVAHMERRYKMMSRIGAKNLDQYNEKARNLDLPQLPFIVIIIDELADLMITSPKEVESAIMRLAQMARATGMHLVLATQRPSVDILTSLIKVNVPARIAFAVASGHDSRTILDTMGAERLIGMGDMLFYQPGLVKPVRLQGPFISESEISNLASFLRRQFFEDEFVEAYGDDFDPPSLHESEAEGYIDWNDDKLRPAAELVIQEGQASVSRLQRRLQVGHARAGKIMDSLEALGVVGPHTGSKPREVLIDFDELPNVFGR